MTAKLEEKCLLTIAVGEDTLLSFYDFQIESTNEGEVMVYLSNRIVLVFMIRNAVGKFVWYGELFYNLYSPQGKADEETKEHENIKYPVYKEDDQNQKGLSNDILTSPRSGGEGASQEFELLLQQQFEIDDQYEETYNKSKPAQAQDRIPLETSLNLSDEQDETTEVVAKMNTIKMFLLNTGLLTSKDINKVHLLKSFSRILS